mgnify:CR=1 FL=1|eukprot:scaffold21745_cov32-Tisochrysis_lutea.AAC.1
MTRPFHALRRLTASTMSLLLAPLAIRELPVINPSSGEPPCRLYPRRWERACPAQHLKGQPLRVVQFNVLGDGLSAMDPELGGFTSVPPDALAWRYRRERLLEEIFSHFVAEANNGQCNQDDEGGGGLPDVVALQELDHYEWFAEEMGARGYDGAFLPKPDSPCRRSLDPTLEDGCALFWKRSLISVEELHRFCYNRLSPEGEPTTEPANQVALVARMRLRDGAGNAGAPFVMGVSHLLARKDGDGERSRAHQMRYLVSAAKEDADACGAAAIILCLDANAAPKRGCAADYPPQAYPTAIEAGLHSAYATLLGEEPSYTTWKRRGSKEAKHTIDYIFLSPEVCSC